MTKVPKTSNFQWFYAIFPHFLTNLVDWNVDKSQQGKNVQSSRLFRWVNFSFLSENVSNYHRLWQNSQLFHFWKFLCVFFYIFDRVCGLEGWKGQQGKKVLASRLFRCVNFSFWNENVSNYNRQKSPKYPILKDFMQFVSNFRQTLWIGTLNKVNKERMCSPVCFSDGLISVFQVKISQITTDYDKIPQLF